MNQELDGGRKTAVPEEIPPWLTCSLESGRASSDTLRLLVPGLLLFVLLHKST